MPKKNIYIIYLQYKSSNLFLTLSDMKGHIIFQLTSGTLNFYNIKKRSLDAYTTSFDRFYKELLYYKVDTFIIKMIGGNPIHISLFYKQLNL